MAWLKLLQVCDDVENHFYRNDDEKVFMIMVIFTKIKSSKSNIN